MNIPGYWTTEEAAKFLDVKVASVYLYARRLAGFPQPERAGRALLWPEADLREWRRTHPSRKR
jgi:predicted DNA-binding transcriptional regulator AlpA